MAAIWDVKAGPPVSPRVVRGQQAPPRPYSWVTSRNGWWRRSPPDGRRATPVHPSPVQGYRLVLLPPFALAAVDEDLDSLEVPVVLRHVVPEVQFLPGYDDEVPRSGEAHLFRRPAGLVGRWRSRWVGQYWGPLSVPHLPPVRN